MQLIEKGGTPTQFLDASNRFYTLIPHDFGMKKPPVLSSTETIKVSCVNALFLLMQPYILAEKVVSSSRSTLCNVDKCNVSCEVIQFP